MVQLMPGHPVRLVSRRKLYIRVPTSCSLTFGKATPAPLQTAPPDGTTHGEPICAVAAGAVLYRILTVNCYICAFFGLCRSHTVPSLERTDPLPTARADPTVGKQTKTHILFGKISLVRPHLCAQAYLSVEDFLSTSMSWYDGNAKLYRRICGAPCAETVCVASLGLYLVRGCPQSPEQRGKRCVAPTPQCDPA